MAYSCVARNIDEYLHQLVRLVTSKHYFYFTYLLAADADPEKVDQRIITYWKLDQPSWRRTRRSRRSAPSIHYLRFGRFYGLFATKGRTANGMPHPFFTEYSPDDIRRNALHCFGYAVKSACDTTSRRRTNIRLDRDARMYLREDLVRKATQPRYHLSTELESEIQQLPYQWYRPVREQVYAIVTEVNSIRRRSGLSRIRYQCIPTRIRPPQQFSGRREP